MSTRGRFVLQQELKEPQEQAALALARRPDEMQVRSEMLGQKVDRLAVRIRPQVYAAPVHVRTFT